MKLRYKQYKRHSHDFYYGEFLIIGTYILGSFIIIALFAGYVNLIGVAVQTLFFK